MIAQKERINLTVAGQSTNLAERLETSCSDIQNGQMVVTIVSRSRISQYHISQA